MRLVYSPGPYHMYAVTVGANELKINAHFLDKEKLIGYIWCDYEAYEGCIKNHTWQPQVWQGADELPEGYTTAVFTLLKEIIKLMDVPKEPLRDRFIKLTYTETDAFDLKLIL